MVTVVWEAVVFEDSTVSILARLTSLDGSGSEVVPGEGACLQRADVSSITCKVFDLGLDKTNIAGTPVTPDPVVSPSANMFDTLRLVGWTKDVHGYNFRHDLSPLYDGSPGTGAKGNWYQVEHRITLAAGGIGWIEGKLKTLPVQTS